MAAETSRVGPCSVTVERIRTGAPARMDARFQDAIESGSQGLRGRKIGAYAERRRP